MNDYNIIVLFGFILLIGNLAGGYHIDDQVRYPHNKRHIISIPKEHKFLFMFSNKKRRHEFLRAAYILEIIGYIEFLISLIVTGTFLILGLIPNNTVTLIVLFFALGTDEIFSMSIYIYYKIRYK